MNLRRKRKTFSPLGIASVMLPMCPVIFFLGIWLLMKVFVDEHAKRNPVNLAFGQLASFITLGLLMCALSGLVLAILDLSRKRSAEISDVGVILNLLLLGLVLRIMIFG